jgi:glutamate synthase (NADPH/NADH) small chain
MEYKRETPKERSPAERVNDWDEIEIPPPEDSLKIQGARCMDCGVPFCHTGSLIKGMAPAVPSTT